MHQLNYAPTLGAKGPGPCMWRLEPRGVPARPLCHGAPQGGPPFRCFGSCPLVPLLAKVGNPLPCTCATWRFGGGGGGLSRYCVEECVGECPFLVTDV